MAQFYYRAHGNEIGPISLELLQEKIVSGELNLLDEFRSEDGTCWTTIADFVFHDFIHESDSTVRAQSALPWEGGHDDLDGLKSKPAIVSAEPRIQSPSQHENGACSFDEFQLPAFIGVPLAEIKGSSSVPATAAAPVTTQVDAPVPVVKENSPDLPPAASSQYWYVRMGHVERGPMELAKLMELASTGSILPTDRVREGSQSDWKPARSIPGLFPMRTGYYANPWPSNRRGGIPSVVPLASVPKSVHPTPTAVSHVPVTSVSTLPPGSSSPTANPHAVPQVDVIPRPIVSGPIHLSLSRDQSVEPELRQNNIDATVDESADEMPVTEPAVESLQRDIESRHKRRRGHYQEPQLFSRRNISLAAVAGIVAASLFFVLQPDTATIQNLGIPYHELRSYHKVLTSRLAESPSMESWRAAKKEYVYRLESAIQKIRKNYLRREARDHLVAAGQNMISAVKSDSSQAVESQLRHASEHLELASREIKGKRPPQDMTVGQK